MYGTGDGSEGSWYEAAASTPFTDGANLELPSPSQLRLLLSLCTPEAPHLRKIGAAEAAVALPPGGHGHRQESRQS
ncbi:hypothetical protein GUJ93_ZPchr0018g11335 [Zizania palustris]|uniref:Uncharacterized protein n=1 Tax=Zizania palustris TaxID=103762 RepID=A0A8J5W068_ZIZPA|nr:hypothetical protein GUJ93_ZPchr0018g11335 [Zizania palustris]